jgi:hypothetical protein
MKGFHHPDGSQQAFLTGLAHLDKLVQYLRQATHACSGREGLNLTGASPVVPMARFRYVAIPQFVVGNHTFSAWCKRPGCPEDFALLR